MARTCFASKCLLPVKSFSTTIVRFMVDKQDVRSVGQSYTTTATATHQQLQVSALQLCLQIRSSNCKQFSFPCVWHGLNPSTFHSRIALRRWRATALPCLRCAGFRTHAPMFPKHLSNQGTQSLLVQKKYIVSYSQQ